MLGPIGFDDKGPELATMPVSGMSGSMVCVRRSSRRGKTAAEQRGSTEAVFAMIEPGRGDDADIVDELAATGAEVLYYGGWR